MAVTVTDPSLLHHPRRSCEVTPRRTTLQQADTGLSDPLGGRVTLRALHPSATSRPKEGFMTKATLFSRAVTLLIGGIVVFAATAPMAASASVRYGTLFQNVNSGKCLDMPYGTTANFATAAQY